MNLFGKIAAIFWDIFFPRQCLGCNLYITNNEVICSACRSGIPIFTAFFCSECRRRIPVNSSRIKKCICENSYIVGAATSYNSSAIRELILTMKYRGLRTPAVFCGELLSQFIHKTGLKTKSFAVVPLPLGRARERERGFNQAALIAEHFCATLSIMSSDYYPNALKRRNTLRQTEMHSLKDRLRNVKGCFSLNDDAKKLKNRNIILIDDVYTSGATSGEAVRVLRDVGVKTILLLAVAKS